MTWVPAWPADYLDATDTESPALFLRSKNVAMFGLASTIAKTLNSAGEGPFLLTSLHRKAAHLMDRDKAILRRDMVAVHREEVALGKLTRAILAKGA